MTERKPFHGKCGECQHIWVVLYLPMDLCKSAEIMKRATCPMCGSHKIFIPNEAEVIAATNKEAHGHG